jgi:hypothetical protein
MCTPRFSATLSPMPRFLLHHRHGSDECRVAFAAWRGFSSPLRQRKTIGSCLSGGHEIWWMDRACDEQEALGHLPSYVAERTEAIRVSAVHVP